MRAALGVRPKVADGVGGEDRHFGDLVGRGVGVHVGVADEQVAGVDDEGREGVDARDLGALGDDRQQVGHVAPPIAGAAADGGVGVPGLQQHGGGDGLAA